MTSQSYVFYIRAPIYPKNYDCQQDHAEYDSFNIVVGKFVSWWVNLTWIEKVVQFQNCVESALFFYKARTTSIIPFIHQNGNCEISCSPWPCKSGRRLLEENLVSVKLHISFLSYMSTAVCTIYQYALNLRQIEKAGMELGKAVALLEHWTRKLKPIGKENASDVENLAGPWPLGDWCNFYIKFHVKCWYLTPFSLS